MIRLTGQTASLFAAIALTLIVTMGLTGIGGAVDSKIIFDDGRMLGSFAVWPLNICNDCYRRPPPPLPHLLHPHLPRVKAPVILCEPEPGDPAAATDCGAAKDADSWG